LKNFTKNFYQTRSDFLDRWVEFQQRRILKKIPLNGKTLLDVGCGSGSYLKIFAETLGAKNLAGLDIFKAKIPGIKTFKGTGEKLSFNSNSFDVVFEKDTLHHIGNKKKALAEMKRVARRQVILVEANLNNRVMDAFIDKKVHHHFSPETLAELLRGEKFEMKFVEAFPFGSNKVFPLKLFNYLPKICSQIAFGLVGKIFDLFEGKKAAFIVCTISVQ